ncbi:MAG: tRNA-dihydrouridine synthase [Nanoarchaeota archaeon]|nr:tRNA-dihydrouridine synthase [Nanoarchaeota archaeon]MBU1269038.1 tRNA-dihydrouridine synthase [Nanoarchaeota archaeon]MBU1604757.1 tRNA-dihydrouridine synthase [Nanoarchaeota archaeon]MBU2443371.1 tRNA-dihydrouridine synthase [Nanoarchaeota archaeon]
MKFLGKEISGQFTIPSGIITTNGKVIERIANSIPEVGIITTKSIGLNPREGNKEPIVTQYAPGCFMNAVGLTNPGAEEFAKQLQEIKIPKDRFILTSIFGKDAKEFVKVAKILTPFSDGLELNLSCPHATGYGMAIGQDPKLVEEITSAVKKAVSIPVVPKLTPNAGNIAEIAKAAEKGGADAICAINTVGPGYFSVDGEPVLTNKKGGLSGVGILPIGLKCIKEISEAVNIPVIGCGGIRNADDIIAYKDAGATIFGVGSALAGLTTAEVKEYFFRLNNDLEKKTDKAARLLKKVDMSFKRYKLIENKKLSKDFSLLIFNKGIKIRPGQFIFAWIPGVGEKPFSVLDNNPLTLAVQSRGCCSEKFTALEKGSKVYFRGPYGTSLKIDKDSKLMLVSGGTGLASLYQIARDFENVEIFIGARDKNHLFYTDKLKTKVYIATNDGSKGHKGFVTDILKKRLSELSESDSKRLVFFNCGPEAMIDAAVAIEKDYANSENIYNSIDYVTKCGVGLCGSCATKNGERSCVDGPFLKG